MTANGPVAERPYGLPPRGARLPEATHVGSVRLLVGDLPRSIDYYERVIGLRALEHTASHASLGPADGPALVQLETRPGITRARRGAFGLFHFALLLPDRASLGRFAAHLADLGVRAGMADHLVSEALYLTDPNGLGIEVYADRPRDTWRHRDRELAMATDPLDVDDLIQAGSDRRWDGFPAGSVMGHIHLHVGDLAEARAYYGDGIGFDTTVWSYPGALFFSAGGYHHHLATNTWSAGPAPQPDESRLVAWQLRLPAAADAAAVAGNISRAGYETHEAGDGFVAVDPWGTRLLLAHGATPRP
jgi:catechol 2,3-dioxygenase